MQRILSTLVILCIISVAWSDTISSQSTTVSSSLLNNTVTKVFSGANTTEWASGKPWYTVLSSNNYNVRFGPSATSNGTIYAYGIIYTSGSTAITSVVRRALNATLISYGNDSTEASVISDTSVTVNIPVTSATSYMSAVGQGYLAILSSGTSTNVVVQVTIISTSASSATPVLVSASASGNTFTLGNIWYDIGSGTFFFTYTVTATNKISVYLGGVVASTGALYWAAPGLAVLTSSADTISNVVSGPNNYLNATTIYVAYKDTTPSAPVTYWSATTKATSTASAGVPSTLVTDVTAGTTLTYVPIGIWASNYTYGIATSLTTGSATYSIENFLNGSASTMGDSGLTNGTAAATGLIGWMLTTGYTLLGQYAGTSGSYGATTTYYLQSFYGNGTANTTSIPSGSTLASSLAGPFNVFEDINGTLWAGWTDLDIAQGNVYNLYVAPFQGQLNPASSTSANALKTIMAFVAFCLAAVFAF